jgi:hypothetical protein
MVLQKFPANAVGQSGTKIRNQLTRDSLGDFYSEQLLVDEYSPLNKTLSEPLIIRSLHTLLSTSFNLQLLPIS